MLGISQNFIVNHWFCKTDWSLINNRHVKNIFTLNLGIYSLLQINKTGIQIIFFLFLHEHICCGYSLEVPPWGTSNEYHHHMFSWRNKKNISTFGLTHLRLFYLFFFTFTQHNWILGQTAQQTDCQCKLELGSTRKKYHDITVVVIGIWCTCTALQFKLAFIAKQ